MPPKIKQRYKLAQREHTAWLKKQPEGTIVAVVNDARSIYDLDTIKQHIRGPLWVEGRFKVEGCLVATSQHGLYHTSGNGLNTSATYLAPADGLLAVLAARYTLVGSQLGHEMRNMTRDWTTDDILGMLEYKWGVNARLYQRFEGKEESTYDRVRRFAFDQLYLAAEREQAGRRLAPWSPTTAGIMSALGELRDVRAVNVTDDPGKGTFTVTVKGGHAGAVEQRLARVKPMGMEARLEHQEALDAAVLR